MSSIVFVCVYNACRSQIAEAICGSRAPQGWLIASAGLSPSSQTDPKAVTVLGLHNLAMASAAPKGFSELPAAFWDYAVAVGCGDIRGRIAAKRFLEWIVPDPLDGPMALYEDLFTDLSRRVDGLLQEIGSAPP